MKGKYKKIYLIAFTLFIIINIAAVFVVFKKYRKDSNNSLLVSNVKFKMAKLKEKIQYLENKVPVYDSTLIQEMESMKLNQAMVDSLLNFKNINKETLADIAQKIANLSSKSGELEKSIESVAVDTNSETEK